ncbi:MAG: universal stress protein [Polyangiales bacterium]
MDAPKHILVAYDFSRVAWRALELAAALRKRLDARVDIVYVLPDTFAGVEHFPPEATWAAPEQRESWIGQKRSELEEAIRNVFGEAADSVKVHVLRGPPSRTILGLVDELGADMVLVGSTGKTGIERALLGSVASSLLRRSHVPVLTVH